MNSQPEKKDDFQNQIISKPDDDYSFQDIIEQDEDDLSFNFSETIVETVPPNMYDAVLSDCFTKKLIPNTSENSIPIMINQTGQDRVSALFSLNILNIYIHYGIISFKNFINCLETSQLINSGLLNLVSHHIKSEANARYLFSSKYFQNLITLLDQNHPLSYSMFKILRKLVKHNIQISDSYILNSINFLINSDQNAHYAADFLQTVIEKQKDSARLLLRSQNFLNLVSNSLDPCNIEVLDVFTSVLSSSRVNYSDDKDIILSTGFIQKFQSVDISDPLFVLILQAIEGLCIHDIQIREDLFSENYIPKILSVFQDETEYSIRVTSINIISYICQNHHIELITYLLENNILDYYSLILPSLKHRTLYNAILAISNIISLAEESENQDILNIVAENSEILEELHEIRLNFQNSKSHSERLSAETAQIILERLESND